MNILFYRKFSHFSTQSWANAFLTLRLILCFESNKTKAYTHHTTHTCKRARAQWWINFMAHLLRISQVKTCLGSRTHAHTQTDRFVTEAEFNKRKRVAEPVEAFAREMNGIHCFGSVVSGHSIWTDGIAYNLCFYRTRGVHFFCFFFSDHTNVERIDERRKDGGREDTIK